MSQSRTEVGTEPRGDTETAWEVFVRETAEDDLVHVGSLTAPTAEVADEMAGDLFADPIDVWLCPAAETRRFSTRDSGLRDDTAKKSGEES